MRKMGRSRGRARERALSKAYSRGAAAAFATANRSAQPRRVALGDAINALTAGPGRTNGLVIDDETRWMMRDPRDDTQFGPINPLRPDAIDPVRPDTRRPEPRLSEYPVAWNLPGSADQPVPWATLRAAAENVDIMRRCISVRKEQLQGLDWSITLDDQTVQGMHAAAAGDTGREDIEAELRRKLLPEIDRLTTFWRNPWKANGVSFEQWVNGIMEDHLVLDAVSIYPRTTYGGELSAFELIDPTTIKLLIDYRGARPVAPFPAFQQILYGFPRAEFGSCYEADGDDAVKPVEGLLADQLFYFREEYRSFTPYGYSAVQQALISARLYLRRQGWMLAEYDDGSTPLTFLVPDATDGTLVEQLTPKTRRQWEDSINAELAGQTRARNRMKVLMPGMTPHQMTGVDERYKPDYDMHLIKMLAGHFGVTSTGLGFSESKGLGNSGLHEGQERTQDAATTKPDKRMIERIVNELMCTYQGAPAELRFKFTDPDTEDQAAEDASADAQRARGTITLNDDRKRIGKAPYPFKEADMPMVKVGDGWMPLEGMAQRAEQQAEAEQALVEDQLANSEAQREATATEAEELSGETAEKALELAAYRRWARKRGGDARRPFICKALAPSDWPGEQVPHDVDFAEWVWVPDGLADDATDDVIEKAFGQGNDNWRTLARDSRGRWVKRGSMRVDALGPSTPDKPVIASLRADAERRRAAASSQLRVSDSSTTMGGMTTSITGKERAQLKAARERFLPLWQTPGGTKAAVETRRELVRRGLLEEYTPEGERNVYARITDAGRAALDVREPAKLTSTQHHVLGTGKTSSAGYLIADRRTMPALQRAGLAEEIETAYGPQWVATDAGRAAVERADADLKAYLDAQAAAKLSPEMRERAAAIDEMAHSTAARHDASVRDVVTSLQDAPGGWVAMADVRRKLQAEHGMDRGQQDAALRRLATTGDRALNTAPEDNQKTLTDADHAAAVDFGAGPQHIVSWDPPSAADVAAAARGRVSGEDLTPGDRIEYAGVGVTVLSTPTRDAKDKFGREMWQFRARRDDTGAEGPMLFGDGGSYLRGEPAERSVLDTVRESSEQAAAASAVIDSAPGLREGVARQQPISHRGGTITPMPPSYEDPNGYVHVVAADGTVLGRRADVATAKLALDNHAKGKPQAGARRMQQSQADRMGITAALRNANVNDPELVTVREEGRHNNPGFALPTTPPAARAEQVAASTPDAPSAAPADHPQKAAYDKLLDGGMVRHKQARQIVEQMEAHGWKLTDQSPMVSVTQWEAPDGRKMAVQFLTSDKPKFYPGGNVLGGNPSYKAALAHVVTPTHEEVGGPNVRAAAARVSPELGKRVDDAPLRGGSDDHVRRLDRAQRELAGYGSTPKRPVADVVAGLRSDADRLDATAQSNAEHHERTGGFGESSIAVRQRREAGELRAIADVVDQQAAERAAYEAEAERRAAAPLDIRPTSRSAAKPAAAKRAEAVAASTPDAPSGTHEDRIARIAPMTENGPQYNRGVRDALDSYREIRRQGYDGEIKLMEAEAAAGLRTQAEVAAARNAEIMGVKTPPAFVAPKLSKKQRDMAARFDKLAGEHAADPDVAKLRARAIELAGEAERINRGDEDAPNAWAVQNQMETVQHEFTHAMAGARAAAAVRAEGGDERAQRIANTRATLDSRVRKVTDEINRANPATGSADPVARNRAKEQVKRLKAERKRYLDRIERAERDHDTKLVYDADGKLSHLSYEPPTAPAAAPSINDMMAANMASSTAAAPAFGAARGKVTGDQIQQGTRVQFRGTAWEVLEKPRRARPDSEGRTGVVFRARREDQGIEGTMRVNDGSSLELAAPKGGGASRPKADATPAAVDARRKPEAIGTRPAAAAGGTLAQRQQVLSAAVTGGVVGERKLGGGQAADTKLVTLADGTKAVHKITTEAQNDHSPRDQVDAEELAGEVAAALGVRTPAMVRTGPTAAYQEFMPGQPGKALYGRDIPDSVLASDDGVRLGLLDHITANSDRHGGNWLVDGDGSLTGIDNGMAFDYRATMGTHNPFGKRHFEDDANPLSPADVARVRERLAALKPRFTAMKRGAWHKAMMARLDEVARGATGTRDFIL